jgi:phosphoglycerate dehydrogenase-like enzyme
MKIVFWPGIGSGEVGARLARIAGATLVVVEDVAALATAVADADVLVLSGHFYKREAAQAVNGNARKLRLIQTFTAGYEGLQQHGVPPGTIVANAGDSWSAGVAEHAMAMLLALVKHLPTAILNQPRHAWERKQTAHMGSLEELTLASIGFGGIGRAFARYARPFGMKVIGLRRNPAPDPLADEIRPIGELNAVLARSDVILIAAPYTTQTHHLLGEAQFRACRKGALLVNVSRGGMVDQLALAAALRSGQLGGAALDVTDPEPLPAHDPFWDTPNLLITPHVAGASGPVGRRRLGEIVGGNVERFVRGEPLQHVVPL